MADSRDDEIRKLRAEVRALRKKIQEGIRQRESRQCGHGYEFRHTAICPGGGESQCEHGFYAAHTQMCSGGAG